MAYLQRLGRRIRYYQVALAMASILISQRLFVQGSDPELGVRDLWVSLKGRHSDTSACSVRHNILQST